MKTAILLSGGLGTRMRPLTDSLPKPLIPVAGKPLINHVIDGLLASGVQRIIVNLHYMADILEEAMTRTYGDRIVFSDERRELLDSGGGIRKALNLFDDEEFFCINADCIWLADTVSVAEQMRKAWNAHTADILKLLYPAEKAAGFDGKNIYDLSSGNRIVRPGTSLCYTGFQILKRKLFDNHTESVFSVRKIWDNSFRRERMQGTVFDGRWLHIGTPQGVFLAEKILSTQDGGTKQITGFRHSRLHGNNDKN